MIIAGLVGLKVHNVSLLTLFSFSIVLTVVGCLFLTYHSGTHIVRKFIEWFYKGKKYIFSFSHGNENLPVTLARVGQQTTRWVWLRQEDGVADN